MDKQSKIVAVFIPALNEEDKIGECIATLKKTYAGSAARGFVIKTILVDDGCTDKTVERAQTAGVDHVTHHPKNLGLGAATRTGMRTAYEMGAYVAVKLDADLQHDPRDIEKCIQPILNDAADIVWGSRFSGDINYEMPLHRLWGNRLFTWLLNVLTDYDISDAQTGLMVFNRNYLSKFQILANYNPPQQLLIDASAKQMRYAEVPVQFNARTTGQSFVTYRYPFKVVVAILWVLIYANPLRVFVPTGIFLFSVSCGVAAWNAYEYIAGDVDLLFYNWGTIIFFALTGLQVIFFGFIADMIARRTHSDT
jgi:glycosyltransferase involved in cell wall biosynthesis